MSSTDNPIKLSPLPKAYRTGMSYGIPVIRTLLNPNIKKLIDLMNGFKGSYVGITESGAWLYIDNRPALSVANQFLDDLKMVLADDVKVYNDITEYRLMPERYKQILIYYQ